jgi:hypothetical protein
MYKSLLIDTFLALEVESEEEYLDDDGDEPAALRTPVST